MIRTTMAYVATAALSLGAAWASRPLPSEPLVFEDTGSLFFPDFDDPAEATRLEVHAWSKEAADMKSFAVAFEDGRWVIPTHHNYPADAVERMGKAAGSFVGVRKDIFVSELEDDHAKLGVLSPDALEGEAEDRGTRVVLQEASGKSLVDIIVGKAVPDKTGYRYLRETGSNRVYASKLRVDLSTRFSDWIERDLLSIKADEIVALELHPYRVDEGTGRVAGDDAMRFELRSADGEAAPQWTQVEVQPSSNEGEPERELLPPPRGKELDTSLIRAMTRSLDALDIVGVRAQPTPLTPRALESKGFFLTADLSQLFGNEGHISATTRDGVVLTLYFGEVSHETGLALSAGLEAADAKEGGSSSEGSAHRYMFVTVGYDATRDESAAGDESQAPAGKARADALSQRFSKWFYVVSNTAFEQLRKDRSTLFNAK